MDGTTCGSFACFVTCPLSVDHFDKFQAMGLTGSVFPDPSEGMGAIPQLFLILVYGFILLQASKTISSGSEMLLLLYGPGLVGGLVIPIMGALPDGMIILMSGLSGSTPEEVKEQITVGVGTLAGSTIMLLTIPWAAGVYLGRRDIDDETGEAAVYTDSKGRKKPKLTGFSWGKTGVTAFDEIPFMAKTMMATTLLYLVIQIPAFIYQGKPNAFKKESGFALAGLILSVLTFLAYSIYQVVDAKNGEVVEQRQRELEREEWKKGLNNKFPAGKSIKNVFEQYDADHNGFMDRKELAEALKGLGLAADRKEVAAIMEQMDVGGSSGEGKGDGQVTFDEFEAFVSKICGVKPQIKHRQSVMRVNSKDAVHINASEPLKEEGADAWGDDVEEEEEDEDHMHELTDTQVLMKALFLLIGGTVIVSVFSGIEPFVDTVPHTFFQIQWWIPSMLLPTRFIFLPSMLVSWSLLLHPMQVRLSQD
jgi:Ca2+/Na+ antiporter